MQQNCRGNKSWKARTAFGLVYVLLSLCHINECIAFQYTKDCFRLNDSRGRCLPLLPRSDEDSVQGVGPVRSAMQRRCIWYDQHTIGAFQGVAGMYCWNGCGVNRHDLPRLGSMCRPIPQQ